MISTFYCVYIRNFNTHFSFQLFWCFEYISFYNCSASLFSLVELIWLQNSIIMYVRFWWKILSYQNRLSYIFGEHNFILWVQILKCLFIKGHFHLSWNFRILKVFKLKYPVNLEYFVIMSFFFIMLLLIQFICLCIDAAYFCKLSRYRVTR